MANEASDDLDHEAALVQDTAETSRLLSKSSRGALYSTISQNSLEDTLLPSDDDVNKHHERETTTRSHPWASLSILLLGVFISQVDSTIVLATYGRVASEFHELNSGSWILSAFIIAQCAFQPLYGKLSDIYSRKSCLLASYVLFTAGTIGVGQSRSLWEIVAWRVVQGAGGAGMTSLVSVIITDIVPKHEVATIRSYVNVLQTVGRSCGGVIGGLLTQGLGWRWAFLIQAPPMIIAIGMVVWLLKLPTSGNDESKSEKLKRVDFVGAFFLASTITAICLLLDLGGQKLEWSSPWILGIAGGGLATGVAFITSAKLVREPIFPLDLLTHSVVVTNYAVCLLGMACQISLMSAVPIYFQATLNVNVAVAGTYLIPAFVGNTLGALLAGYWIKKTGRYKIATVLGPILSLGCMLLVLTWNGSSSPIESVFIFPGGFATGVVVSSTFIGLIAGLDKEHIAVAASGLYFAMNIGSVGGVSAGSAASQVAIRSYLDYALEEYDNKDSIIRKAVSEIEYVQQVKNPDLHRILVAAYTRGFHATNFFGIGCSVLALLLASVGRGTRLEMDRE